MTAAVETDIFDNDERIIINNAFKGILPSEFTQKRFLENLRFGRSINSDSTIAALLEGLELKVSGLTDSEWDCIKSKLPLFTPYDESSIEDPVINGE